MVRAKFLITEKKEFHASDKQGNTFTVTAVPVTSGSPENDQFYRYTPGGQLVLSVVSKNTADMLVVGKQYYLDITEAE